jgi:hypothetical protein
MSITRKQFVGGAAAGTVLLLFQGCGGGGSSSGNPAPAPAPSGACGASGAAIAGNHGHSFTIPSADLDSMVDKSYSIAGTAGHDHTVVLTPANMVQLKANQTVTVTSSSGAGHDHVVTVSCA